MLHSLVNAEAKVWENSRADCEHPRRSRKFPPAREFSQTLPRFSPGYEARRTRFISFIKLLVFDLTKGKTI